METKAQPNMFPEPSPTCSQRECVTPFGRLPTAGDRRRQRHRSAPTAAFAHCPAPPASRARRRRPIPTFARGPTSAPRLQPPARPHGHQRRVVATGHAGGALSGGCKRPVRPTELALAWRSLWPPNGAQRGARAVERHRPMVALRVRPPSPAPPHGELSASARNRPGSRGRTSHSLAPLGARSLTWASCSRRTRSRRRELARPVLARDAGKVGWSAWTWLARPSLVIAHAGRRWCELAQLTAGVRKARHATDVLLVVVLAALLGKHEKVVLDGSRLEPDGAVADGERPQRTSHAWLAVKHLDLNELFTLIRK